MQLSEMDMGGIGAIEGYGPGFFRVGGRVIEGAMLVTVEGAVAWDGLEARAAVLALAGEIDVVLFGMGAEVMNSPAACRTWNLLAAEGRRVALAALPV